MKNWMDLKSLLVAVAFFAVGFLAADRMTPAAAAPMQATSDTGAAAFAGTSGAFTVFTEGRWYVIVVKDGKVWRMAANAGSVGATRPWTTLTD